jgi:hypothetical protein
MQTRPYSFKTGNKIDFKARHVNKSIRQVFPVDYNIEDTDKPTYQPNPGDAEFHFDSLTAVGLPKRLVTIRVTVLKDATLLGFRFPHHFVDGNSQYELIQVYCDLVANKKIPTITVPPDVETPLSNLVLGTDNLPAVVRSGRGAFVDPSENVSVGFWPLMKFIAAALSRTLLSKIGLNAKDELRFIHIPATIVKQWQEECQRELDHLASEGKLKEGAGLRLSKNDILTAWFLKVDSFITLHIFHLPVLTSNIERLHIVVQPQMMARSTYGIASITALPSFHPSQIQLISTIVFTPFVFTGLQCENSKANRWHRQLSMSD